MLRKVAKKKKLQVHSVVMVTYLATPLYANETMQLDYPHLDWGALETQLRGWFYDFIRKYFCLKWILNMGASWGQSPLEDLAL